MFAAINIPRQIKRFGQYVDECVYLVQFFLIFNIVGDEDTHQLNGH